MNDVAGVCVIIAASPHVALGGSGRGHRRGPVGCRLGGDRGLGPGGCCSPRHRMPHGGQGESLVPPYARGSVSRSLS